jgi:hypothetical protein
MVPSSERHRTHDDEWVLEEHLATVQYAAGPDWAKEQDNTVIVVRRVDETPWRNVELTGANRTPSPATIAMVNNVLGQHQAVTEPTQPVAGEHPSIRRT